MLMNMLRYLVREVQKRLSLQAIVRLRRGGVTVRSSEVVPDDVMEGQFAVLAIKGGEAKRFVVDLDYLSDPAFLLLLEHAEQEYGFRQKGALAVPCSPRELENILAT